jgi:hypothetical protein
MRLKINPSRRVGTKNPSTKKKVHFLGERSLQEGTFILANLQVKK